MTTLDSRTAPAQGRVDHRDLEGGRRHRVRASSPPGQRPEHPRRPHRHARLRRRRLGLGILAAVGGAAVWLAGCGRAQREDTDPVSPPEAGFCAAPVRNSGRQG